MIEVLKNPSPAAINRLGDIWLAGNLSAHPFISADYWHDNLIAVKTAFSTATIIVAKDSISGDIQGFLGLMDDDIAGIFVDAQNRDQGLGQSLLHYAQTIRTHLTLSVYVDNVRAFALYERMGFKLVHEGVDAATGAAEYTMEWQAVA